MDFRVLGPLDVHIDGEPVDIKGGRAKALLAALLLHANRTVSRPRLIELVWADPPDSVDSNLRGYLARLRQTLRAGGEPASRLITEDHGHRLRVDDGELDLDIFESLAARAKRAAEQGDAVRAADLGGRALRLWQGHAFDGVPAEPALRSAITHVNRRRDEVYLATMRARVDSHQHAEALGELRQYVTAHPLCEPAVGLLMLALYRCGRQREALDLFRDTGSRLGTELSRRPGRPLAELHRRMLSADPLLDSATGAPRPSMPVRPAQLPGDIPAFTGRAADLSRILEHARGAADTGTGRVIGIDGPAGVGKTTLAVHAAHRLARRFADGQLFVDAHTSDPDAPTLSTAQIQRRLLGSLGVAETEIPPTATQRTRRLREVLKGLNVLIVVDDVADAANLATALPHGSGSLLLATGRDLADRCGGALVSLSVLPLADASRLFRAVAGLTRVSPLDDAAIADIVVACGNLPAAVRNAASRYRSRPGWTLRHLSDRLAAS